MINQASIRNKKLNERNSLSFENKKSLGKKLANSFAQSTSTFALKKVALYFSVENEAPTNGIINLLEKLKIKCYFPIISSDINQKVMKFAEYKKNSRLVRNSLGIPEPMNTTFVDLSSIDLFLLPLVAFDVEGYRVGMGMGYYDTTLLELKNSKTCKIWGIAYEFQEEESCFPESHDLKLDAILCPSGLREFV